MSMHITILSGMNALDTTNYLKQNNFKKVQIFENQIQRYVKVIGKDNPIRVCFWIALNTKLTQILLSYIRYRIKNIIFLYDITKPLTLIRAKGWWKIVNSFGKNYNMVLCSVVSENLEKTRAYDKMISHISNKFLQDNITIPHYSSRLNTILKKFLNV